MRKLLWLILVGPLIASCSDDNNKIGVNDSGTDTTVVSPVNLEKLIIGEWVADYAVDDPKGYRWEILKFLDNGLLYFSNYSHNTKALNTYVNAEYSVKDSVIITNCLLGWSDLYETYNTEIRILKMNEYELEAELWRGNNVIEKNTYRKVIGELEINQDEISPNYQLLFKERTISGYKSHNNYIAVVDEETGKITRGWSGSTYIDVMTDKGTALLHIINNSILDFDYVNCIGKTKESIIDVFDYGYEENNYIYYLYNANYYPELQAKSGNWKTMGVLVNPMTGLTEAIVLIAKDDIWFTEYQIFDYLSETYSVYEDGTEEGYKAFVSGQSLANSKVGMSWNSVSQTLSFISIQKRVFVEIGNEEYTPNYKEIIGDASILKMESRNNFVATVDSITGIIKGVDSGKTIIDILTNQGNASIHLTVKAFLTEDYESLLGGNKTYITNFLGVVPYSAPDGIEGYLVTYDSELFPQLRRETGNWNSMLIKMTNKLGEVTSVELVAKDDVWFTAEEMNQYLSERYHAYSDDTNETIKAYINNSDYDKASAKILWDMEKKILTYQLITHDSSLPIFDFGRYIGKTRDEAKDMMNSEYSISPFSDSETALLYVFNGENITAVSLKFDANGIVNSVQVRLVENAEPVTINEELSKAYIPFDDNVYNSIDGKLRVTYIPSASVIKFEMR